MDEQDGRPVPASSYHRRAPSAGRRAWRSPPGCCWPDPAPERATRHPSTARRLAQGCRNASTMHDGPKPSLASPSAAVRACPFRRLWAVGGLANAMRWVETLVAAIFTFEATARPSPSPGRADAGAADAAVRRRRRRAGGDARSPPPADDRPAATCASAWSSSPWPPRAGLEVWHLAASSFLGGLVWTGEMASRRRMVTEVAGERDVVPPWRPTASPPIPPAWPGRCWAGAVPDHRPAFAFGSPPAATRDLHPAVRGAACQVTRRFMPRQLAAEWRMRCMWCGVSRCCRR